MATEAAAALEFRVLGPLILTAYAKTETKGSVKPIPQPLLRRLICVLVTHVDRPLPKADLKELLWPDAQTDGALRTCRSSVRRIIGAHRFPRGEEAQLLLAPEDRTDLGMFRDAVAKAKVAAAGGDLARAAVMLIEALDLWRDARLADLPDNAAVRAVRDRLAAELRQARELLVGFRLESGSPSDVVPLLRTMTAEEPLDEELWRLLMLALYRSGRRGAALGAYKEATDILAVEAGTAPSGPLQTMMRQIRDDDSALLPPGGAQHPPLLLRQPPRLRQLPPDVHDFTGRASEVRQLTEGLTSDPKARATTPIAVIAGPAGYGKTTLATRVAHAVAANYPDGQFFLQLAGSSRIPRDPAEVLGEILRALGAGPSLPGTLAGLTALYRSAIADRRMLVVIDDARSYGQVLPLMPGTSTSAVIVTSRVQSVSPIGGLLIQLEPLTGGEALQLLRHIVGDPRVKSEPDAAADLVTGCCGSPLAVRIVGARLAARPSFPLSYLARRLMDPGRRLDELAVNDDFAVRATIATSYATLPATAQAAFRRLSLPGPHDVAPWVVAVLLGARSADDPEAAHAVDLLVDASLLQPATIDATGEPRYRLHDLVRDYAAEQLVHDPAAEVALERLLGALLELTDLAAAHLPQDPHFPGPVDVGPTVIIDPALAGRLVVHDPNTWLQTERLVLLSMIATACATRQPGRVRLAAGIAMRIDAFLHLHGHLSDAEVSWRTIIAAAEECGEGQLAETARCRLATLLGVNRGRPDLAVPMLDHCAEFLQTVAGQGELSRVLYMRAYCHLMLDRLDDSRVDAERAFLIAEQQRDKQVQALALRMLGLVASKANRHDLARDHSTRAVALAREIDQESYLGIILYTLIHVMIEADQFNEVLSVCEEAIALAESVGHGLVSGYYHLQAGQALSGLGRHRDALPHLELALERIGDHGTSPQDLARVRFALGRTHQELGDHQAARLHLERSAVEFRDLGLADEHDQAADALAKSSAVRQRQVARKSGNLLTPPPAGGGAGSTTTGRRPMAVPDSDSRGWERARALAPEIPNPARIGNQLRGGKSNFPVDEEFAAKIRRLVPNMPELARINRRFGLRAVRFCAQQGIDQFIDVGTGYPVPPSIYDVIRAERPEAIVIGVDNDPDVLAHDRAWLESGGMVRIVDGDIRRPAELINELRGLVDLTRPVAWGMTSLLHFVTVEDPCDIVATVVDALAAGSYVIISHGTRTGMDPTVVEGLEEIYAHTSTPATTRTVEQIRRLFNGLDLVEPGLVDIQHWWPDQPEELAALRILGGVAQKTA
jgi:DNA-binding SARP family transcriptional activator/tetratricopeptide (TPR) repeat protein